MRLIVTSPFSATFKQSSFKRFLSSNSLLGSTIIKISDLVDKGHIFLQSSYRLNKPFSKNFNIYKTSSSISILLLKKFLQRTCFLSKKYLYQSLKKNYEYAKKFDKSDKKINWNSDKTSLLLKISRNYI